MSITIDHARVAVPTPPVQDVREELVQQALAAIADLRDRPQMSLGEAVDFAIHVHRPVLDELAKR